MTPLEVNTAARRRYNATGDDFWSDAEIYDIMWQACNELATECLLIENVYTTTSVASQQQYDWPTNAIAIKRITYNGRKLVPITFREDDVLTVLNQNVTTTGTPTSYAVWDNVLYLRALPANTGDTIEVWTYNKPQVISSTSTLEIPSELHMSLVDYILGEMSAKNKNYKGAQYYANRWNGVIARAKKMVRKKLIGDGFQFVKNVDILPQTDLGNI